MSNTKETRAEDEIKRLRRALDEETRASGEMRKQLDRANAEFEEFVSMAAHDLREALRDVASYSQLVVETHAGRLDSDTGQFLERIRAGAARMQSLLSDVVDYWATDPGDRRFARTNMEAVVDQVLLSAARQIAERGAIVTHDPLPSVTGDFEVLTKVLHHLVRNAIEYCDTPSPRVHISSRRVDDDWVFSVEDKGPGIDPAFSNRVFGAFKRLHGREYPGNGLGLAFCKKAIERHGGRLWVASTVGTGSTFYFTLPPAD